MQISTLSVLVPVFNEEATIEQVLLSLLQVKLNGGIAMEIIVIDDGSTDNTAAKVATLAAQHPQIRVLTHPRNTGKGSAIHSAIPHVNGEMLVIQDADLEYDPRDLNALLQPALEHDADVVYGTRFSSERPHRVLYYWHHVGNRLLTTLTNMFGNLNLTDMETCYKLMRTDHARALRLKEKRFGFEPEITLKLAAIPNIRFYEVGISYHGRTYAEGKKIRWTDGVYALWCIFKYGIFR